MNESTRNIKSKKILSICIIVLISFPLLQYFTGIINTKSLKGSFDKLEKPQFSFTNWFQGNYQLSYQKYFNENIGFRSFFVKIYNQNHYILYNDARANGIIIGNDKYLYAKNYIRAHLGKDFIGRDSIEKKVVKIQKLTDTLHRKGIDLIILLAPGKGSFYPEFIPEEYNPDVRTITNYEVYRDELLNTNIRFLDFNSWFRKMKNTSSYPLFPKTGIYWSKYGEVIAADSIIKYINSMPQGYKVPEIKIEKIETSRNMRDTDDDIEKGMNILFDIKDLKMGYPQFEFENIQGPKRPKVLTVADSYYWGMYNYDISRVAFNNGQFWFYNEDIYPKSGEKLLNVKDIDFRSEIEKNDIILLLSTDANLSKFAFGFIDQLFDSYFPHYDSLQLKKREERVQYYINAIKETPQWLKAIAKKARMENMPLDKAIRKDAEYMAREEETKKSL